MAGDGAICHGVYLAKQCEFLLSTYTYSLANIESFVWKQHHKTMEELRCEKSFPWRFHTHVLAGRPKDFVASRRRKEIQGRTF
jgi:hypothetical protein